MGTYILDEIWNRQQAKSEVYALKFDCIFSILKINYKFVKNINYDKIK